jgi:hypothetical protein
MGEATDEQHQGVHMDGVDFPAECRAAFVEWLRMSPNSSLDCLCDALCLLS